MMKQYVLARVIALQEKLKELNLDAAMIYDRENLIYFAGVDDLEGGALAVPSEGEPELFCMWMDSEHMHETSGIKKITPYYFPKDNQSTMMGKWLKGKGYKAPRLGFTRYFISLKDFQCLRDAAPDLYVGDIAALCYQLRSIKCAGEIYRIEAASDALKAGMDAAIRCVEPGMPETEVLAEAQYAMQKAGSQGSSFRMQVLTRGRQMLMHPYAGNNPIQGDAPVVIHLGASFDGYVSKMCRTVFLGNAPKESLRIYEVLKCAQKLALENLHDGITCRTLYNLVTDYIIEQGYERQWMMEHIGYGVGIRQSEFYPIIAKGSDVVLKKNMVIDLLLPTIYVPDVGGPRITDTILVREKDGEVLTNYSSQTIIK